MSREVPSVVVLGAGPAGLGAAACLAQRRRFGVTVVEQQAGVGGNAGSFEFDGMWVDYGSHRLHRSCPPEILADISNMLGSDLLDRPRHGRIRLRGRWIHFPLRPLDLAFGLPVSFGLGVAWDSLRKRANGGSSFAEVLESELGHTICYDFYFPYAEKIWGVRPTELDPEQARRRVSANSVSKMLGKILRAVPGVSRNGGTRFFYPRYGFGQISQAYHRKALDLGADVRLGTVVTGVDVDRGAVVSVTVERNRRAERLEARVVLSTIPLPVVARALVPAAPTAVLASADALSYRAMILVYLSLATDRFTEYDAHYFPEREIGITRLSEPKNYGLTGPSGRTVLCAELPCSPADEVWGMTDLQLGDLALEALARSGLKVTVPVRQVATRRLEQAYPVYLRGYRTHFDRIVRALDGVGGLVSLGRQGLFAHDNTHHTLAMAYAASDCVGDDGVFDLDRWVGHRRQFETNVVED